MTAFTITFQDLLYRRLAQPHRGPYLPPTLPCFPQMDSPYIPLAGIMLALSTMRNRIVTPAVCWQEDVS